MASDDHRKDAGKPGRRPWRLWRLLRVALIPLAILSVVGLLVFTVISYRVSARFEARELEAPSHVYGRVIRLDAGRFLPAEDLKSRLKRLGYRLSRSEPGRPGEYLATRSATIIHTRGFPGPAGEVEPRLVRVTHRGPRIARVEDARSGNRLDDVLLEPEVLTTLYGPIQEDRQVLSLADFPQSLVDAVLVTEDKYFYRHPGLDPTGLLRAALTNVRKGSIKQGGSTLTQQLAKNLYFDQERTWSRKASEAVVAVILEARYGKDRILRAYLNEVYLGQRGAVSIRGFAQAASFYFGKDVRHIDLSESATLAGLIRAPGVYNPFVHPDRAVERRNQVLAAMVEEGRINEQESRAARARPLKLRREKETGSAPRSVSYLADYVRQMMGDSATGDLTTAGMRIFTTVDPVLQRKAEEALSEGLMKLERSYRRLRREDPSRKLQGAIVVLDPKDGSVLAMVGGRDYATSQFNRITQARRQPGSLFKPFVYLAGYRSAESAGWGDEAFTPATRLADEPLEMKVGGKLWAPANYDNEFRGPVTAQEALEQSLNVPTIRAAKMIGLKSVVETAKKAGIESDLKPYPSLALGAQEVTPLEIAAAFATLANHGVWNRPALVESIQDASGRSLHARKRESRKAIPAGPTYLVTVGLQGALDRGTAASSRGLGFTGTAAGKTGTTDDFRDAWFAGYTPDLLALVWVGFDDGDSTRLSGAQAALPIWVDFILKASASTYEPFEEPAGIVWAQVDPLSGGLARWSCPESRYMAFLEGAEPADKCNLHGWFGGWWSRRHDEEPRLPIE